MTASQLFGGRDGGIHECYYCGGPCDGSETTRDWVKSTFTNRDIVARPGSEYVCRGCVETFRDHDITLIDGEQRGPSSSHPEARRRKGQRVRQYSWIITRHYRRAATKAHIAHLRQAVLDPPDPPFAIVLADSGQKQLLFRAPVAFDRDIYPLMLEDEVILVDRYELPQRIETVKRLIAALGKPALFEPFGTSHAIRTYEYHQDDSPLVEWGQIRAEPLSRLAAWLAPNKEECAHEYPKSQRSGVSPKVGGLRGRVSGNDAGDKGGDQADGDSLRLDLS